MDKESEESSSPSDAGVPVSGEPVEKPAPAGGGLVPVTLAESSQELERSEEEEGGPIKTFLEHLEDLRWVFIRVLAALLVAMVGCLAGAPQIIEFLKWPLLISDVQFEGRPVDIDLQPLGPLGAFFIAMKLALYGGLTIALPFILYFVADFVMPALKKHEKTFFLRAFIVGAGLFLLGVMVCYFFALPLTLRAMIQYSNWMGFRADFWRAEEYFSFVTLLMIAMGASFELPVVVLALVKVGVIQYEWLTKGRPYIYVSTFAAVAFITPDFVSTFFLVIPMMVLMEICIWIAWWWQRKARKEALQSKGRD